MQLGRLWRLVQRVWRASIPGKVTVVAVADVCAAAVVYVCYLLLFGGSLF